MLEFMQVYPYFDTNDFHAKVIEDFLFIEAEVKHGTKGVNYTTFKFKTCRKFFFIFLNCFRIKSNRNDVILMTKNI